MSFNLWFVFKIYYTASCIKTLTLPPLELLLPHILVLHTAQPQNTVTYALNSQLSFRDFFLIMEKSFQFIHISVSSALHSFLYTQIFILNLLLPVGLP